AFRGGGVGAGVRPGAGAIRTGTDIMVMATRMATATVPRTATVMATAMEETNTAATTAMAMAMVNTARPLTPESPNCSADSHALVIIMARSTAFWARRRVEQSARTSGTTDTQATDRLSFAYTREGSVDFSSSTGGIRRGLGGRAAGRLFSKLSRVIG